MSTRSFFYSLASATIIVTNIILSFLLVFVTVSFGLANILPGAKSGNGEVTITIGSAAVSIGLLAAVFSLLPSYKLCMKMAERLRFRGWPLEHPRRLFALSLFLLILPIILLMLSGIVFGA